MSAKLHIAGIPSSTTKEELNHLLSRWSTRIQWRSCHAPAKGFLSIEVELDSEEAAINAAEALNRIGLNGVALRAGVIGASYKQTIRTLALQNDTRLEMPVVPRSSGDLHAESVPARSWSPPVERNEVPQFRLNGKVYLGELPCERAVVRVAQPESAPVRSTATNSDLCAASATRAVARNAVIDLQNLDRLCPTLIAPLAAYVQEIIRLQRAPEISPSDLRGMIEKLSRFFVVVFCSALTEKDRQSEALRRYISGFNESRATLLDAGAGQAVQIAGRLVREIDGRGSPPWISRALNWWKDTDQILTDINRKCNPGLHVSLADSEVTIRPLLAGLNEQLSALGSLRLALFAIHGQEHVILIGSSSQDWEPIKHIAGDDEICLSPFLTVLPNEKCLLVFQGRNREGPGYQFLKLGGGQPLRVGGFPIARSDRELSDTIDKRFPISQWQRRFAAFDNWKANSEAIWNSQDYGFNDLREQFPRKLYGRNRDLSNIRNFVNQDVKKLHLISIEGPQDIGKSAIMWTLSNGFPLRYSASYFFRERDRRCSLQSFVDAISIAFGKRFHVPIKHTSLDDLLSQLVELCKKSGASQNTRQAPLIFVDGLDVLRSQRPADLVKLLDAMRTFQDITWVCGTQPIPEVSQLLGEATACRVRYTLAPLSIESREQFLREELKKMSHPLSDSDTWIKEVAEKPDAGLPQFIRAVLDGLRTCPDYRDPREVPRYLDEHWNRSIDRLRQNFLVLRIFALLSVALAPLGIRDIAQIIGEQEVGTIRDAIEGFRGYFEEKEEGWSITPPSLRQFARTCKVGDIRIARASAARELIAWALEWQNHETSYPLEFLPDHLDEENHREQLRRLAFRDDFLAQQRVRFPHSPSLPIRTLHLALKATIRDQLFQQMFALALRCAEETTDASRVDLLAREFRQLNFLRVSHAAELLDEEQEQTLWKLLASICAMRSGDTAAARQIASQVRIRRSGSGAHEKYERPIAVLLGILESAAAEQGLKFETIVSNLAEKLLGINGIQAFFSSLAAVNNIEEFESLLPSSEPQRLRAVRGLANALARRKLANELISLAEGERTDDVLVTGAVACAGVGEFALAERLSRRISSPSRGRVASVTIAAEASLMGCSSQQTAVWLEAALRNPVVCLDGQSCTQLYALITTLAGAEENASNMHTVTAMLTQLGIIQAKYGIEGDSLLRRAEQQASLPHEMRQVLRSYYRLGLHDDIRRVSDSLRYSERLYALAESNESELQSAIEGSGGWANLSGHIAYTLVSTLARNGSLDCATEALVSISTGLHSHKAAMASLWGRPRILGEIAALLYSRGRVDEAVDTLHATTDGLRVLPKGEWDRDRIYGLLNLASAWLRVGGTEKYEAAALLTTAAELVMESRHLRLKRRDTVVEILAEIWSLKRKNGFLDPSGVLKIAFEIAGQGDLLQKVKSLNAIARRQVVVDGPSAAHDTLQEAMIAARQLGAVEIARVLLASAQCGLAASLDIGPGLQSQLETDIYSRPLWHRALVELRCHDNPERADQLLDGIKNVDERARAARNVAKAYVANGNIEAASRVVEQKIGCMRSQLLPDVAEAIAEYCLTHPMLQETARAALENLLLDSACYLDGTYRVLAAILRSNAFNCHDNDLVNLADTMKAQQQSAVGKLK